MTIVMMVPLCAVITVLGPQIGEALFASAAQRSPRTPSCSA